MNPHSIGLVFLLSLTCATLGVCDSALAGERHNTKRPRGSVQAKGQAQRKPLDLTLPRGVHAPRGLQDQGVDDVDPFSLNLFAKKKEQTPLRIKGRLLMNDEADLSIDTLDGAQIIFEVQTQ